MENKKTIPPNETRQKVRKITRCKKWKKESTGDQDENEQR